MARIRITGCPKMQQGGSTDGAQFEHINGQSVYDKGSINFRSPDPQGYISPVMSFMKPLMPKLPYMDSDGQATYSNYGQGANYEAVGNGAAGDVFGKAHGQYQKGGRTSILDTKIINGKKFYLIEE